MTNNYFVIELYSENTFSVSIMSKAEVEAVKDSMEDWQYERAEKTTEDEMIERAEDKGYEHDPW